MNLNADNCLSHDPSRWSALQTEICMNIALAKRYAFIAEADRAAELVRLGFISRVMAADYLHIAAFYNQLTIEYGTDAIQEIIADALSEAVA